MPPASNSAPPRLPESAPDLSLEEDYRLPGRDGALGNDAVGIHLARQRIHGLAIGSRAGIHAVGAAGHVEERRVRLVPPVRQEIAALQQAVVLRLRVHEAHAVVERQALDIFGLEIDNLDIASSLAVRVCPVRERPARK